MNTVSKRLKLCMKNIIFFGLLANLSIICIISHQDFCHPYCRGLSTDGNESPLPVSAKSI
jgi:hypothetical protein